MGAERSEFFMSGFMWVIVLVLGLPAVGFLIGRELENQNRRGTHHDG